MLSALFHLTSAFFSPRGVYWEYDVKAIDKIYSLVLIYRKADKIILKL